MTLTTFSAILLTPASRYYYCMSNLVPEVRVDKNGKTSTRWVKPEWARGQSANKKIPAVSMQGIGSHSTLLRILNDGAGMERSGLDNAIGKTLSAGKAEQLVEFLMMDRVGSEKTQLQSQIMINIENPRIGKKLNELIMAHYDKARAEGIGGMVDLLTGIGEMNRNLTTEQEWALLKVTSAASHFDAVERVNVPFPFDAYALRDEKLIDLVIENPEMADDIAMVVRERQIENADTIRGLLDGGETHKSLAHGTL
jgi:hypothetical protein